MSPRVLYILGVVIMAPIWAGTFARFVVKSFSGHAAAEALVGLAILATAALWSALHRRRAKKIQTMSVTHWDVTETGVTFHGHGSDGEAGRFVVGLGAPFTVTTTKAGKA